MITTTRKLLTPEWQRDVESLESAIARFTRDRPVPSACQVAFFEIDRGGQLHVNVTHERERAVVKGWTGPAHLPQGFVYNRRFGDTRPDNVVRHIRNMVFAEPIE